MPSHSTCKPKNSQRTCDQREILRDPVSRIERAPKACYNQATALVFMRVDHQELSLAKEYRKTVPSNFYAAGYEYVQAKHGFALTFCGCDLLRQPMHQYVVATNQKCLLRGSVRRSAGHRVRPSLYATSTTHHPQCTTT